MKYTLLELTQSVLRSIKGEAVNSLSDTQESLDVADIIKECYFTIVSGTDLPETKDFFELDATGGATTPILMAMPEEAYSMEWLEYNCIDDGETESNWKQLTYLQPLDFLKRTDALDTSETNVDSVTLPFNGINVVVKYRNDKAPDYFTSGDDNQIIFDSYIVAIEANLQKSKTRAYGICNITWEVNDEFTPNLDAHQFQLLLKEAKAMAWQELKMTDNVAAVRSARRLQISARAKNDRVNQKKLGYYYDLYPNYGRK